MSKGFAEQGNAQQRHCQVGQRRAVAEQSRDCCASAVQSVDLQCAGEEQSCVGKAV